MRTRAQAVVGYWERHVMPRLYDRVLCAGELAGMSGWRARLASAAEGRVLELGAGTGLNMAHYTSAARELVLTEPEPAMAAQLRRRSARAAVAAQVVEADAQRLPFADGSFDTVLCTFVLCTVPDPLAALREARRMLSPGGRLLFLEHVRAGEGSRLALWQDRLRSPWRVLAAGCRCNQDTLALLEGLPFRLAHTEPLRWRGMPPLVRPVVLGEAVAI